MSRKIDGRKFESKWMNRAKQEFGLNKKGVISLMKKAGIKNLNSSNDIRGMRKHVRPPDRVTIPTFSDNVDYGGYGGGMNEYNDLLARYNANTQSLANAQNQINRYRDQVSSYKDDVGDFERKINEYEKRFTDLKSQYQSSLSTAQSERDALRRQFEEKSAEYDELKQEQDAARDAQVSEQLRGLRSGATSGGANQTSYASGDMTTGRTGYSSNEQDRDRRLADFVVAEGGATDSVLNKEGPVVQIMDKRKYGTGRGNDQSQARYNTGGSGSYYASRFGS